MKLYRFSPIQSKDALFEAIKHIHFECYKLCKDSFDSYLPNSGNIGVFCHYNEEYEFLTNLRKELTEESDSQNQKYFRLREPIVIPAHEDVPETTYTYLYIRKPDPYRHHVGDIDFYLEPDKYIELKQSLLDGDKINGARIFPRTDLDMIELYNPDVDVLAYVSTSTMAEKVRIKPMAEIFDLYDPQNKPLGITKPRVGVHRDGDWHRTVHIYVVNDQGQFLVHLRSPLKDAKPNCWDTRFGGHVIAGMDYEQTALQELEQEIGIITTLDNLIAGRRESYDGGNNREHVQAYYYRFNGNISDLHFNDNEVIEVKWMSPDKILQAITDQPERWATGVQTFQAINEFYKKLI